MRIDAFDYVLPPERIAQEPATERDGARLMVLPAGGTPPLDRRIRDLPELLGRGDLLVVNDTRVRPSRLTGRKESGGVVEVLLLERRGAGPGAERWSALVRASRAPRAGTCLELDGGLDARLVDEPAGDGGSGERELVLSAPRGTTVEDAVERVGRVPLPPYIERAPDDPRSAADAVRYQTVYAREDGSSAAPTAGLHFTDDLLERLRTAGVEVAAITLHVGLGTFQPVRAGAIEDHTMHPEWCRLPAPTAAAIQSARARGGRVVAVGTTVVRTLEARWGPDGPVPGAGPVDLFIRPGHAFRAVDVLLTNFHLPRSTLLVLVSAFAGRERVLAAYHLAVERGYRFYSYGDAMLVLP